MGQVWEEEQGQGSGTQMEEDYPGSFQMVSRSEWGKGPSGCNIQLRTPVPYLIIHHVLGQECHEKATCRQKVKGLQELHIKTNGWCDVAYNFLIGEDGIVYEGVGWTIEGTHTVGYNKKALGFAFVGSVAVHIVVMGTGRDTKFSFLVGEDGKAYEGVGWDTEGAHTYGYNDIGLGIAFMGFFTDIPPNAAALKAAQDLIQCSVDKGYLDPDYLLVGHSDVVNTLSPGHALYDQIKTWPHFKH
ncbi:peptidoglycan recognition protein 3-like [Gracilinanus agilis]|uniref:peptidoglycan recognition protein 3-like n=1 Tax=Gracilinanus agilis TaxID=191870 RepID=UPI001CFF3E10|nr:peptidoglycan recognition protein 3-like [Gracilinanus agilis]